MPPSRSRDNTAKDNHSVDERRQRYHKKANPDEPGVQKLKSSLRQTRRLLAKVLPPTPISPRTTSLQMSESRPS
ncbi:hypothetical protein FRC08_013036, partial [Ceratobasidium sp. 394]